MKLKRNVLIPNQFISCYVFLITSQNFIITLKLLFLYNHSIELENLVYIYEYQETVSLQYLEISNIQSISVRGVITTHVLILLILLILSSCLPLSKIPCLKD